MAHHSQSDVRPVQIAHADAPIVRAPAVELAAKFATENEGTHRLGCPDTAWLITFGSREALETNRQAADLDGVAVADVGDGANECPAATISSHSGPGERQETGKQAEQAVVHDLLITNVKVENLQPSYT